MIWVGTIGNEDWCFPGGAVFRAGKILIAHTINN